MAALKTDGALLLICEVEYFPPGSKISVEQAVEAEPLDDFDEKNEVSIRDSLKDMLDSELFADCTIKVHLLIFSTFEVVDCIIILQMVKFLKQI